MIAPSIKKNIYISFATLLGALLGALVASLAEAWVIYDSLSRNVLPQAYPYLNTNAYIPLYMLFGILLAGVILGFWLGHSWWRMVYIENRHWFK